MKDTGLKWYFSTSINAGGHGGNDPLTDLFPGDRITNLVRESIQNSLDQCNDYNHPVQVKFRLRSLSVSDYPNLMDIKDHIDTCAKQYPKSSRFNKMGDYFKNREMLVLDVSDFNTKGMDYDFDTDSGRFRKFVRYSGDPNDDASSGGSHGYGKITYFNVSGIRTIVVSSLTPDSRVCTFEGVSRLATHNADAPRKTFGDTGFYDKGDGNPIQMMEKDLREVDSIIPTDFQRSEPGTTISILFAEINDKASAFKECCQTVLRSFFAAIQKNLLSVSVDFTDGYDIVIDQSTIEDIFQHRFFQDCVDIAKNKVFERLNPHPYWMAFKCADVEIPAGTNTHDAVCMCEGKQYIKIHETLKILGDVTLHVFMHHQGTDTIVFMRKPLMMVNILTNRGVSKGFYGVFECSNKTGNDLLREMENAPHNLWSIDQLKRDAKPQEAIVRAGEIEKEMKEFIDDCISKILFPIDESEETDICLDDFTLPVISDDVPNRLLGSLLVRQGHDENILGGPVQVTSKTPKLKQKILTPVQVQVAKSKPVQDVDNGEYTSGSYKNNTGGGGTDQGHGGNDKYSDSSDGEMKIVRQKLNVGYRFIPDHTAEGQISYVLVITSDIDAENVILKISPIGDAPDLSGDINIQSASVGKFKGGVIDHVNISKGKTRIIFTLAEQDEYTFSLNAEHDVQVNL